MYFVSRIGLHHTNCKQLPWLSRPELSFPARRALKKRKQAQKLSAEPPELPETSQLAVAEAHEEAKTLPSAEPEAAEEINIVRPETPSISLPASENNDSTNPTTPSSSQQQHSSNDGDVTPVAPKPAQRQAVPVIPVIPALPKVLPKSSIEKSEATNTPEEQTQSGADVQEIKGPDEAAGPEEVKEAIAAPAPTAWTKPKLWAGLFNPNAVTNGTSIESGQAPLASNGVKPASETLADALLSFNAVSTDGKISFLQPRGLVNTGNMCYMNSVSIKSLFLLEIFTNKYRFYKFLSSVVLFTTSWTR